MVVRADLAITLVLLNQGKAMLVHLRASELEPLFNIMEYLQGPKLPLATKSAARVFSQPSSLVDVRTERRSYERFRCCMLVYDDLRTSYDFLTPRHRWFYLPILTTHVLLSRQVRLFAHVKDK